MRWRGAFVTGVSTQACPHKQVQRYLISLIYQSTKQAGIELAHESVQLADICAGLHGLNLRIHACIEDAARFSSDCTNLQWECVMPHSGHTQASCSCQYHLIV